MVTYTIGNHHKPLGAKCEFTFMKVDDVHSGPRINEDCGQQSVDDCHSDVSQIEPMHSSVLIPIHGGSRSGTVQFWALAKLAWAGIAWGAWAPFPPVPPFGFNCFSWLSRFFQLSCSMAAFKETLRGLAQCTQYCPAWPQLKHKPKCWLSSSAVLITLM